MIAEKPPPYTKFVANIDNWQRLVAVNPEADGLAWTQVRIPICRLQMGWQKDG